MNTRQAQLLTAVAAFAGGFLAGLLFAPHSGREARRRIARTAQGSTQWVGDQLHALEDQLGALEDQLQAISAQFGEKVREVTDKTVGQYVPKLDPNAEAWKMEREDVTRDLRHLPRK